MLDVALGVPDLLGVPDPRAVAVPSLPAGLRPNVLRAVLVFAGLLGTRSLSHPATVHLPDGRVAVPICPAYPTADALDALPAHSCLAAYVALSLRHLTVSAEVVETLGGRVPRRYRRIGFALLDDADRAAWAALADRLVSSGVRPPAYRSRGTALPSRSRDQAGWAPLGTDVSFARPSVVVQLRCPFHDDDRPSAMIVLNPDGRTGGGRCLACVASSGVGWTFRVERDQDGAWWARGARAMGEIAPGTRAPDPADAPPPTPRSERPNACYPGSRDNRTPRRAPPPAESTVGPCSTLPAVRGFALPGRTVTADCRSWWADGFETRRGAPRAPGWRSATTFRPAAGNPIGTIARSAVNTARFPPLVSFGVVVGRRETDPSRPRNADLPDRYVRLQPVIVVERVERRGRGGLPFSAIRTVVDAGVANVGWDLDGLVFSDLDAAAAWGEGAVALARAEPGLSGVSVAVLTSHLGAQFVAELSSPVAGIDEAVAWYADPSILGWYSGFGARLIDLARSAGATGGTLDLACFSRSRCFRRAGPRLAKDGTPSFAMVLAADLVGVAERRPMVRPEGVAIPLRTRSAPGRSLRPDAEADPS